MFYYDKVYSWSEKVCMVFNAGRFELLCFWLNREVAPDILYIAPDGVPIEEKDCLRNLGVREDMSRHEKKLKMSANLIFKGKMST